MTREIRLSRGLVALVDDADYEWLSQWKWSFDGQYAARKEWRSGTKFYLHRELMKPLAGLHVDHINHEKLDCTRANMRVVTRSQNSQNGLRHGDSKSPYKGAYQHPNGRWYARIMINKKRTHLGTFATPEEAAARYDQASREHYGAHAQCNFEGQTTTASTVNTDGL